MPNKLTYFQESWLSDSRFESWVSRSKDKGNAALLSHASGSKHNIKFEDRKTARDFFRPKSTSHHEVNKKECEINIQITSPQENSEPKQLKVTTASNSTIDACFRDSSVQKAEIMWALKHAQSGFSNNSCKGIVSLFQSMFPDSQIVQKMKLEPNKLKYVVNYGVAPYVSKTFWKMM